MNVKIPNGMKSPTVVILSGGIMTGDEKSNKVHEKRMDMLERKLDQQYKNRISGVPKDFTKSFEQIQKSFVKKIGDVMFQNKQSLSSQNSKLLEAIKSISQKVKVIKSDSGDNGELKSFMKKIDSLEEAIRKISLKKTINVNPKINIEGSFEKLFARLENKLKDLRPRMTPSPS